MTTKFARNGGGVRVESIDLLRGLVMLLVALDFTRYYTFGGGEVDPTNLAVTTIPLFFTRWITHFFAPGFLLLAGLSAFFKENAGRTKKQMSAFLLTRGLFIIVLEILVIGFLWKFQINIFPIILQFIWVLGLSMLLLAVLVWLPLRAVAVFSLVILFGHNLLDEFNFSDGYWQNIWWGILHNETVICADICNRTPDEVFYAYINYPLLPWGAVMTLGYSLGGIYKIEPIKRQKFLIQMGALVTVMFFVIRGINGYGNSAPWSEQKNLLWTIISFLNTGKYPPSLSYLLMTVGPLLMLLGVAEKVKSRTVSLMRVFGSVPLLFYVLSLLLAHTMALVLGVFQGFHPGEFLAGFWRFPDDYGLGLFWIYLIWAAEVVLLYPICEWYADLRTRKTSWIFTYF